MSGDIEQHIDTNSAEFKQGVEAGLNGGQDMKNWKAGNELGQELKAEVEDEPGGDKGNPQDGKDETEE